jgi:glycerol-3-phosphate dehydrogenase (NAD(P)+)
MSTTFSILGAGAWGTAIAILLAQNQRHRVRLWSARPPTTAELLAKRENVNLLPGILIPEKVVISGDARETVAGADLLIVAVPTVYMRSTLAPLTGLVETATPVLSLAKGVENETFFRPTEILSQLWGVNRLAALSGPSHAEEVSRGLPASLVSASEDADLARQVQADFSGERFRVYTNADLTGVEFAGALKNVLAIAAGISDGLGFGDNAKAALLTRGLVEMARFGVALGGEQATFYGLAGLGDVITTCFSPHGRNRRVGVRLAAGESLDTIVGSTQMVAEGVYTTRSVFERARQMGIEMPIVNEVYRVLYESKSPLQAVGDLMLREPRHERPSV